MRRCPQQLSLGAARVERSMTRDEVIQALRVQLLNAMCSAQSLPVPRTPLARMLTRLLHHAFDLLDDERRAVWERAQQVAIHALASWNASKAEAGKLLVA